MEKSYSNVFLDKMPIPRCFYVGFELISFLVGVVYEFKKIFVVLGLVEVLVLCKLITLRSEFCNLVLTRLILSTLLQIFLVDRSNDIADGTILLGCC